MTKKDILDRLQKISRTPEFAGYKFGLVGSYARGEETPESDIDILVDRHDMTLENMELLRSYFKDNDIDILCTGLLAEEDKRLDALMTELDIPINEDSVYKSVTREVIWSG